jgi:uncharacterized protein (DUF1778 family)
MAKRNDGPTREGPVGVRLPPSTKQAIEEAAEANRRSGVTPEEGASIKASAMREGPVGVRLPPPVKEALEAAAEANQRSLHGEIVHRLAASVDAATKGQDALAELFEVLVGRLAWLAQSSSVSAPGASLAIIREGFAGMMDDLLREIDIDAGPNGPLNDDQLAIAGGIGHLTAADLRVAEPLTGRPPPGMEDQFATVNRLVRLREALGIPSIHAKRKKS